MNYYIPRELLRPIDEYRQRRKIETGKVLQRTTAITELLQAALDCQPKMEKLPTYDELVRRVEALESVRKP